MPEVKLTPLGGMIIEKNDIPLDELADRIRELLIQIALKSGPQIWEVGNLLRLVRLDLPSDEHFGKWVSVNFPDTDQKTLYNYYQLAVHFYERQELAEVIPQSGLYLLAAPKCNEFREDIIEDIEGEGERVSIKAVQKAIKSHMPTTDKEPQVKKYPLTNDHIMVIWKAMNMAASGASESDLVLYGEIKGILGTPTE